MPRTRCLAAATTEAVRGLARKGGRRVEAMDGACAILAYIRTAMGLPSVAGVDRR